MEPVLTRAQIQALETHAIQHCHIPSLVLMENAGRGAADAVERLALQGRAGVRVLVMAGPGNNGGDGFALARHLFCRGMSVTVWAVDATTLQGDAALQYAAWVGLGQEVHPLLSSTLGTFRQSLAQAALGIDALFGTGLSRPITGWLAEAVEAFNTSQGKRISLDLPSGLHADTGCLQGATVQADHTLVFGFWKLGLLTPTGVQCAGAMEQVSLGLPLSLVDTVGHTASLLTAEDITPALMSRRMARHKGENGRVCVIGGAPGTTGAAWLAARAALRAGAGLVTLASWKETLHQGFAIPEVITLPLMPDHLPACLHTAMERQDALVLGPGFGLDSPAQEAVAYVLATYRGACVVDADALTLWARGFLTRTTAQCILTPHAGEAARLLGISPEAVERDRMASLQALVQVTDSVVVLKGVCTLIGAPDGRCSVAHTSSIPALATAGTGDVLAGLVAAYACGLPPFEAACTGVYVHGLAAQAWSRVHGDHGLLASELADSIPTVIAHLCHVVREHESCLAARRTYPLAS